MTGSDSIAERLSRAVSDLPRCLTGEQARAISNPAAKDRGQTAAAPPT